MDITPAIRIACMGGIGCFFGVMAKSNPKIVALTWIIGEIAMQILQYMDPKDKYHLESSLRSVTAGVMCFYLVENRLITKTAQIILSMVFFCTTQDILTRLGVKLIIGGG